MHHDTHVNVRDKGSLDLEWHWMLTENGHRGIETCPEMGRPRGPPDLDETTGPRDLDTAVREGP